MRQQKTSLFSKLEAFKTPHKGDKIGIMRILSIGVDFTQDSAWNNENATITFDLYYQK